MRLFSVNFGSGSATCASLVCAVQRERVKPERHRLDSRASASRVDLDRQQVSHPPLSLRDDEPLPAPPCADPVVPIYTPPLAEFLLAPPDPSADVAPGRLCCRSAHTPAHP